MENARNEESLQEKVRLEEKQRKRLRNEKE